MFESMRKAVLIGMGAAAMSWDKMKEMVDDLVEKGDLSAEEGKRLFNDMTARAEEQGQTLNERVRSQIRQMLTDMGVADRTQIAMMESRIASLERRIVELEAAMPSPEVTDV